MVDSPPLTRLSRNVTLRLSPGLLVALGLVCAFGACRGRQQAPPPTQVERELVRLDGPWHFRASDDLAGAESPAFDDAAWDEVRVPHTWGERQLRSAWYRSRFSLGPADAGKRIYLRFEGVASVADVYVNGVRLGQHRGAFTAFVFDATPHVRPGENLLALRVSNHPEDTEDCLPSGRGKQLYYVYGGIYRKAWLLKTSPWHVDPTDHASPGVYITPVDVRAEAAGLRVRTLVRNSGPERKALRVRNVLLDHEGREVAALGGSLTLAPGRGGEVLAQASVTRPRLWSPAEPYLYQVRTELWADDRLVDAVSERTGFRALRLEGKDFLLNGAPILLRGVGKHQETEDHASAVSDEELREDFRNLKDLGVNFVRLAHYPHARLEYDLADEAGILVWAENGHSNAWKGPPETGDTITREMIRQNYNHPSIVVWSVGNETGFIRVRRYSALAKSEDASRLVAYASNIPGRRGAKFTDLDLVALNTYRGWYRGSAWEFEERALGMGFISESGGGAVVSNHADYAAARHVVDRFEPEEYRQLLAEVHFQVAFRDHPNQVPLYLVWILRDFAVDKYKGRNTKGLLTYSNFKKDAYYLYQSFLRPDLPVVHVTSKTYFLRRGSATDGVKVYSNRGRLALTVNGEPQGERRNGEYHHPNGRVIENVFYWPARLRPGRNEIAANDGEGHSDAAVVYYFGEGSAPAPEADALVADLRSSNRKVPAYFIDRPIEAQWPFHHELDGSADNTIDGLPAELEGARFISTPRLSKPGHQTDLSFTLRRPAAVFVMLTAGDPFARALEGAGFRDAGLEARWRGDDLRLRPARLLRKDAEAGEAVRVPGAVTDYLVLLKERR